MAHAVVPFGEAEAPEHPSRERVAPQGWYPDPARLRYWNGVEWTDAVRPIGTPRARTRVLNPVDMGARLEPVAARDDEGGEFAVILAAPPDGVGEAAVLDEGGLWREMGILALVVTFAIVLGGLVTALGIAFTV